MKKPTGPAPTCSVSGCPSPADVSVFFEDGHTEATKFCQRDVACPYLCMAHARQNEEESTGLGRSRQYPFSKQRYKNTLCGWTTYRDIRTGKPVRLADVNGLPFN